MILYITFDMYLFQVLPLLPWISEFSKIMIIIYFVHRFHLTSHIRGHMLSAKMALLHLSADIHHVATEKDKLGLKWPKHYRCAWPLMHDLYTSLIYFYFEFRVAHTPFFIATRVPHASICIATRVYIEHVSFLWATSMSYVPWLYIYTHVCIDSTLKNINHD